jgi:hypothetical protein
MEAEIRLQRQHRASGKQGAVIDSAWLLDPANKSGADPATPQKSQRQDLLERRAALLAWLDPAAILDPNEPVSIADTDLAAVLAACEIVVTSDGPRRRLAPDVRRAALKRMATRPVLNEVLAGLSYSTEDPIQRMLVELVKGESPAIERLDRNALAALLVVTDWFDGILDGLPDPAKIRARLAREDLVAPLRNLAKTFVGREQELDQLRSYLGDVPQGSSTSAIARGTRAIINLATSVAASLGASAAAGRPLFIHGIGGVGKSTLVAHFGLELADHAIPFVFLDLDRPHLDPRKPTTLLAEAARQLRVQLPTGAAAAQKLAEDLDAINLNIGERVESESISGVDLHNVVDAFCKFVHANTSRNLPFIIDTFEVAQSLGDSPVYLVREMLAQLRQGIPNFRPMICGRVLPDATRFPAEPLALTEFDLPSAEFFLARQFEEMNPPRSALAQDADTIAIAVRSVERTPLALGLTAQLIADHGIDTVRSSSIFGIVLRTKDAAFLYSRVLNEIPEGPMRKLAKPGLVLRRLSPAVIKDVLSGICALDIRDEVQAQALFENFAGQVSLVEREPGNMLRHRPDVRRLMLPALEREVGHTKVSAIDQAAVEFHAKSDDPVSRAEELYHRLRLSDIENFDARWRPDVADRLRDAMEDFEPQRGWAGLPEARVALSLKLGLTPDAEALNFAGNAQWERATATRVAVLLQQAQFQEALKVLHERPDRSPASQLYRQEAEALMGVSRFQDALAIATRGVASAQDAGDNEMLFENAQLAARACEATNDKAGALNWVSQATAAAVWLGQADKLLRAAVLQSRLGDWTTTAVGQLDPALQQKVQNLLKSNLADIASAPLLRALAAATGDNTISRTVLRRLGVERMSPGLSQDLAVLIAGIAGGDGVSPQSVRAILASANESIPAANATVDAWSQWLAHTSGTALGNALAELSGEKNEYGVTPKVMDWISRYFREIAAAPQAQAAASAASAG